MFLRRFALMNCILYVQWIVLLPTNNIRWSIVVMLKALHRWREGGSKHYTEGEGDRGFRNPGIVLMYSLPLAYIQWFKSNIISSLHAWLRHISQKYLGNTPPKIIWVPRVGLRRGVAYKQDPNSESRFHVWELFSTYPAYIALLFAGPAVYT